MNRSGAMTMEQAVVALSAGLLLLVVLSPLLAPLGMAGIASIQVLAFGIPAVVVARVFRGSTAAAMDCLAVRLPTPRVFAGALLVGVSFWYLNLLTVVPLSQRLLGGARELDQLGKAMFSTGEPVWVVVAVIAIAPAVCEELLMRGAMARAIDRRYGRAVAVIGSAVLFGLLHMSLVRFLPTAVFGLVLAHATLASGSVVASMVIHLVNNGIAVTLASGKMPGLVAAIAAYPLATAAGMAVLCASGVVLLRSATPEDR